MKSVKIMLSAVLVMAVLAGALAFKAKKVLQKCVYTTTSNTTTVCPYFSKTFYLTTTVGGIRGNTLVIPPSGVCPSETACAKITEE